MGISPIVNNKSILRNILRVPNQSMLIIQRLSPVKRETSCLYTFKKMFPVHIQVPFSLCSLPTPMTVKKAVPQSWWQNRFTPKSTSRILTRNWKNIDYIWIKNIQTCFKLTFSLYKFIDLWWKYHMRENYHVL